MNRITFLLNGCQKILKALFLVIILLFSSGIIYGQPAPTITAGVTSDLPNIVNCSCTEITITVKNNSPFEEVFIVQLNFPNNGFETGSWSNEFSKIPNTLGDVISTGIEFDPGEVRTFVFKGTLLNPIVIPVTARVNRVSMPFQFFTKNFNMSGPNYIEIDGTNTPVSLQNLINTGVLLNQQEACSFNPNPSPPFQTIYIKGVLEIDTDYCFRRKTGSGINQDPLLVLFEDAEIIVKDGVTLFLNRRVVGCTDMWKSITVEAGGILNINKAIIEDGINAVHVKANGTLNVQSTTFIDNYIGVHLEGDFSNPIFEYPILNMFFANTFIGEDNLKTPYREFPRPYAGVYLNKAHSINIIANSMSINSFENHANGIISDRTTVNISSAKFSRIRGLPDGTDVMSINGVEVNGVGIYASAEDVGPNPSWTWDVIIENSDGWVNGDASFEDCDKGIELNEIHGEIRGHKMINVKTGIEVNGIVDGTTHITDNWIEPVDYGIKMLNNNFPFTAFSSLKDNFIFMNTLGVDESRGTAIKIGWTSDLNIVENTIDIWKGKKGLFLENVHDLDVSLNTILYANGDFDEYCGIQLEGGWDNIIQTNLIEGNASISYTSSGTVDENLSNFKTSTGIFFNSSSDNLLSCNNITSNKFGFKAWGVSTTSMETNSFSKNFNSLLLGHYDDNGNPDGNAWIGFQGNTPNDPSHHGNRWLTSNLSNDMSGNDIFGAVHLAINNDIIQESAFEVNQDVNNSGGSLEFMPAFDTPNSPSSITPWFNDEINPALNCTGQIGDPDLNLIPSNTEIKLTQGQDIPTDGPFEEAIEWTAGLRLFKKIMENDDLINSSIDMQSFFAQEEYSSIGHFYNIENGIEEALSFDENTTVQMEIFRAQIKVFQEAIYDLDVLINNYPTPSEYEILAMNKIDLINSLGPIYASFISFLNPIYSDKKNKIELLKIQNSNFIVNHIFEENEKMVNDIYLNYFTFDSKEMTKDVIDQLKSIANQCPLSGSNAVFKARALLMPYDDKEYDDVALCQSSDSKRIGGGAIETRLKVYPNPAYDMIVIEMPKGLILGDESSINLVNTLGQVILTEKISSTILGLELNVKELPSGLYNCVLMKNDKPFIHKKIMVIKN